jgi:hypothetical protein
MTKAVYLYNPFMTDGQGKQTNILSPGAMIKTAVLISDIISRQGSMEYAWSVTPCSIRLCAAMRPHGKAIIKREKRLYRKEAGRDLSEDHIPFAIL